MSAVDRANAWSYSVYGFWGSAEIPEIADRQLLDDFRDETWFPNDGDKLAEYLAGCPCFIAVAGWFPCGLCDEITGVYDMSSDGHYVFPPSLAHEVQYHAVVLPDRFVEHIRRSGYRPPTSDEVDRTLFRHFVFPPSLSMYEAAFLQMASRKK